MSYSISVSKALTKAAALEQINTKLDEVLAGQPAHAADIEQAKASAAAFVGVLRDPADGEAINVNISGSVTWTKPGEIIGAGFNISGAILPLPPA
jgi:hypothetical protein